jgi:hypothetical protein
VVAGVVVLIEGLFAGYSALAANWPEATGWTLVGTAPFMVISSRMSEEGTLTSIGGVAGLGLYDALVVAGRF